jgi:lipid-A-disaccharide synthase
MPKLFIVAGEESSDLHAANLFLSLKALSPDIQAFGLGGRRMEAAGVTLLEDMANQAVIGFWEVLKKYSYFKQVMDTSVRWIKEKKPDAVILVDSPGFNLRLAKKIQGLGIPIIYYICPQVWAWGKKRIQEIENYIDKMLVILPFETKLFSGKRPETVFVGHPLLDIIKINKSRQVLCSESNLRADSPLITFLPGSRHQEIEQHLPVMLAAGEIIHDKLPEAQFVLVLANPRFLSRIQEMAASHSYKIKIATEDKYDWRAASDVAMVCSGTATLETAILGVPMVIVYRVAWMTYFLARWLIKIPYIGLVNVVAEKKIVPELIQYDFTPQNLANEIMGLLQDKAKYSSMKDELVTVRYKLGDSGASENAAREVLKTIHYQLSK